VLESYKFFPSFSALIPKVSYFANGGHHMVALTENGYDYCWGVKSCGQSGNGTSDPNINAKYKPEVNEYLTIIKIICIDCGADHVLALSGFGEVFSWGYGLGERIGKQRVNEEQIQLIPFKIGKFHGEKN
jgi:regulator of chromosome condensation